MSKFRNFTDRIANQEQFQRTQLAKFSRFFGIVCNVFLASYFIYGGLTIPQKGIGLVVMACGGFSAGLFLVHMTALWFSSKNGKIDLTEMHHNKSKTINNNGENDRTGMLEKSKFLKIKRTIVITSVLLVLTFIVVGFNTSNRGLGLALMAGAGFFGFILLISIAAKGFRVQSHHNC